MINLIRYPGIFQPYNVSFQKLFKLSVKKAASESFVNYIAEAVSLKKAVWIPTNVDRLKNATPKWLVNMVPYLNKNSLSTTHTEVYLIGCNTFTKYIAGE